MKTSIILFWLVFQSAPLRAPAPMAPRARVDGGIVEGSYFDARTSDAVFKAIPFAAPPVGDLRWKPPAPVRPWRGVRGAK
ncbi:MAG: carboxylesterase family protein, partial [Gemmatimonadaceae bacterium]